jgi:hypothetical protein
MGAGSVALGVGPNNMVQEYRMVHNLISMWLHFVNLLSRSWDAFLSAMGTTGLGFFTPVLVFALTVIVTLLVIFFREGREKMIQHWRETAGITVVVTVLVMLVVYVPIFTWNVVKTVYRDHADLVSENREIRRQSSRLVDPKPKDDEIAQLKSQIVDLKGRQDHVTRPRAALPANHPEPPVEALSTLTVEGRLTCSLKEGAPLPEAVQQIMAGFGTGAIEGPSGRIELSRKNPVEFRHSAGTDAVTIVNYFYMPNGEDSINKPLTELLNFKTLSVPITILGSRGSLDQARFFEVTMLLNGQKVWHYAKEVNVPCVTPDGRTLGVVPLDGLDKTINGK